MFNNKCKEIINKKVTIRSLLDSINNILYENPNITMDSEILVSDLNMQKFIEEFKIYPTYDYRDKSYKVGIYLSPNKDTQENLKIQNPIVEDTQENLEWLKKYRR